MNPQTLPSIPHPPSPSSPLSFFLLLLSLLLLSIHFCSPLSLFLSAVATSRTLPPVFRLQTRLSVPLSTVLRQQSESFSQRYILLCCLKLSLSSAFHPSPSVLRKPRFSLSDAKALCAPSLSRRPTRALLTFHLDKGQVSGRRRVRPTLKKIARSYPQIRIAEVKVAYGEKHAPSRHVAKCHLSYKRDESLAALIFISPPSLTMLF